MMKLKTKKIPYYLLVTLLTLGASLILGLLSFGGMYALLPMLPLAVLAFVLSVTYEGEIYLQNIKGALNKLLFKTDYLEQTMGNTLLLSIFDTHFKKEGQAPDNWPTFFNDYQLELQHFIELKNNTLSNEEKKEKKRIKKSLKAMEAWFATQVFHPKAKMTPYEQELHNWLKNNTIDLQTLQTQLASKKRHAQFGLVFSAITTVFMTLGTLYLLASVPFLAAAPLIILVPMAMMAGAAYGLLIYNTITNMIQNDTFKRWYETLKADFEHNRVSFRNVFFLTTATLLVTLAVALTVCTAGTWWTVAKHTPSAIHGLKKLPSFIMGVINPIFTGIAALLFNLENTSETLKDMYAFLKKPIKKIKKMWKALQSDWNTLREREHWLQLLNPFRLLLIITMLPLQILFFLGHLLSIGVSADRMPGIPMIVSTFFNAFPEFFEDLHYFFDIGHHHEPAHFTSLMKNRLDPQEKHHHHTDIPTLVIQILFSPIFALAVVWDWAASQRNSDPLRVAEAVERQTGIDEETFTAMMDWIAHLFKASEDIQAPEALEPDVSNEEPAKASVSQSWKAAHAELLIKRHIDKHLSAPLMWNHGQAIDKQRELKLLQSSIREEGLNSSTLQEQQQKVVYAKQRFSLFAQEHDATRTVKFLDKLSKTVGMA